MTLQKTVKSVLLGLKRGAHGIGAGGCEGGTYANLLGGTMAVALMVLAVLYITADALIDVAAAVIFSIHFPIISFQVMIVVCAAKHTFIQKERRRHVALHHGRPASLALA